MLPGSGRRTITLIAAVLLCLWVAGLASANGVPPVIGPINYEWYQGTTHRGKVEETFVPWQYLQTIDNGSGDWFKGPGINCWEYTVDVDPGIESNAFSVNTNQITLAAVWNANSWTNPSLGTPLNQITWSTSGTNYLDGQTGLFRIWAAAQRGIVTGEFQIVRDGVATGPVSGPTNTPEPGSLALLACGAVGLLPLVRRKLLG